VSFFKSARAIVGPFVSDEAARIHAELSAALHQQTTALLHIPQAALDEDAFRLAGFGREVEFPDGHTEVWLCHPVFYLGRVDHV
jgi:hypothetical protein